MSLAYNATSAIVSTLKEGSPKVDKVQTPGLSRQMKNSPTQIKRRQSIQTASQKRIREAPEASSLLKSGLSAQVAASTTVAEKTATTESPSQIAKPKE